LLVERSRVELRGRSAPVVLYAPRQPEDPLKVT
jgi:hypothetical protein